ncbi:hypothetical protein [[Clostridium] polysaccharolyticum]|uniref:CDP-diacylglycerol--glycerol-3-phosphate 3-phosphatidyltransferase n=1 Tax=[Clostridium] polysaccharolyticum TaxID=29364 RepID=A0A1I0DCY6_9FIRM|nr:hypothetical protein [[Clostridium] polysaccharolyticum]SET30194.1 hypothetical protein SAMN04487772_11410 [[Clostridium] polysaccharolyticum]
MKKILLVNTYFKLICTLGLLFIPTLSTLFVCVYSLHIVAKVIGLLIPKTFGVYNTENASFDSISDIIFNILILVKLLLYALVYIPEWDYIMIISTGVLKTFAHFVCMAKFRHPLSFNTVMNSVTGFLLLIFPYLILVVNVAIASEIICGIACLAAVEELTCALIMRKYVPRVKCVFSLLKRQE